MPGFGAIGVTSIGVGPTQGIGSFTLVAAAGSFAFSGSAATFTVKLASAAGSYLLTGNAATFSTKLAVVAGAYVETGNAATFTTKLATLGTSYAETGNAATFTAQLNTLTGAYVVTGFAANVIILEAESAGGYIVTGYPSTFTRDFINWLRSSDLAAPAWGALSGPAGIWTPAINQPEVWTGIEFAERVFDPFVFENTPVFDTGSIGGVWFPVSRPVNPWTKEI